MNLEEEEEKEIEEDEELEEEKVNYWFALKQKHECPTSLTLALAIKRMIKNPRSCTKSLAKSSWMKEICDSDIRKECNIREIQE